MVALQKVGIGGWHGCATGPVGCNVTFCRDLDKQVDQRLAEVKPELLREWHPSRNADLRPGRSPRHEAGYGGFAARA
ncbi:MAG: hypothetical protein MZV70_56975 [Desulfobacterales bacterium]|nr:hypothetical protein [Desulfobacterales bacterium]